MSDTPRTDRHFSLSKCLGDIVTHHFARTLERELAAVTSSKDKKIAELQQHISGQNEELFILRFSQQNHQLAIDIVNECCETDLAAKDKRIAELEAQLAALRENNLRINAAVTSTK